MEAIVIKKSTFDSLFKQTLEKLELVNLREDTPSSPHDMHRRFHYEVCILKGKLEKGE